MAARVIIGWISTGSGFSASSRRTPQVAPEAPEMPLKSRFRSAERPVLQGYAQTGEGA